MSRVSADYKTRKLETKIQPNSNNNRKGTAAKTILQLEYFSPKEKERHSYLFIQVVPDRGETITCDVLNYVDDADGLVVLTTDNARIDCQRVCSAIIGQYRTSPSDDDDDHHQHHLSGVFRSYRYAVRWRITEIPSDRVYPRWLGQTSITRSVLYQFINHDHLGNL